MFTIVKAFIGRIFPDKLSLYFILGLFGFLAVIVLYNSDAILSRFGFETTSSLKAKIATLESEKAQLVDSNKRLLAQLDNQEKIHREELASLKRVYEEKIAKLNNVKRINKDLEAKNKVLAKALEEQRVEIAKTCHLDPTQYYLYTKATYDDVSLNNIASIQETLKLKLDKKVEIKMFDTTKVDKNLIQPNFKMPMINSLNFN